MGKLVKDLKANPENPRKITDEKLNLLYHSMDEYGDISGIVFNVNTGNIVGGTQRTSRLNETSKVVITKTFDKPTKRGTIAIGYVELDGERFSYREVKWSKTKERGAMLAANKSAGEWDVEKLGKVIKDLSAFDADFDLDLTMFDKDELVNFGFLTTTVREHERSIGGDGNDDEDGEPEPPEEPEKLFGKIDLYNEDCFEALKKLPDNSVDALVTDPPYGWRFMGKAWDGDDIEEMTRIRAEQKQTKGKDGNPRQNRRIGPAENAGKYDLSNTGNTAFQEWTQKWAIEVLRVLKPGAHCLIFCGPRTYHRMACGVENAGFEIRDQLQWLFGSGFPKSLDISKAIDKAAGHWRGKSGELLSENGSMSAGNYERTPKGPATTPEAKQWEGWGTALKPANEPILLARKPLSESTVAENVLKWGTGGINIDAGRIGYQPTDRLRHNEPSAKKEYSNDNRIAKMTETAKIIGNDQGRFPANLLLDEEAAAMLDEQSAPNMHSAGKARKGGAVQTNDGGLFGVGNHEENGTRFGDTGGASRFFYVAKTSASEKNLGLEGEEETTVDDGRNIPIDNPFLRGKTGRKNIHPTVKPVSLMRYLCRLVTPIGGVILDPFMGSGTTGVAALRDEFQFIGIEREAEYFRICEKRLNAKANQIKPVKTVLRKKTQSSL